VNKFSLLLISVGIGLAGCATTAPIVENQSTSLSQKYEQSIIDASTLEHWEVTNTLNPVSVDNSSLHWKRINGNDHVLVVTWVGEDISWAKNDPITKQFNTSKYDNWVTLFPEVKMACSKTKIKDNGEIKLSLEQTLGLPPNSTKANFIEYWVQPKDLFRPCRDPEVHDNSCQVDYPTKLSNDHKVWLENQQKQTDKYPWTQLGYTYNWSEFGRKKVGLSEYIIRKHSDVVINKVQKTSEYCG